MDQDSKTKGINVSSNEQVQVRDITAYKFAADGDELYIKMLGKKQLSSTVNLPESVAGTMKIDNMHIPVIDPRVKRGQQPQEITDSSCVVLSAVQASKHGVTTAAIYPDLKKVLEFILKQTKN